MFLTQSQLIISFITITCLLLFSTDNANERKNNYTSDHLDMLSPSIRNDKKILKFYFCVMLIGFICYMYFKGTDK